MLLEINFVLYENLYRYFINCKRSKPSDEITRRSQNCIFKYQIISIIHYSTSFFSILPHDLVTRILSFHSSISLTLSPFTPHSLIYSHDLHSILFKRTPLPQFLSILISPTVFTIPSLFLLSIRQNYLNIFYLIFPSMFVAPKPPFIH